MNPAGVLSLKITRTFDAPRVRIFDAWTNPESSVGWWGPAGFTRVSEEVDLRPGGRYRLAMRSPEGKVFVNGGAYREIVAPERLVMTHGWADESGQFSGPETLITVTFFEEAGRTVMTFEQTGFDSAASRDGHDGGWSEAFDSLADAVIASRLRAAE